MWQLGQRMEFIHFVSSAALVTTWITFGNNGNVRRGKRQRLYRTLLELIAHKPVPERVGRCEPRVRKRRPKSYPAMQQPRELLRRQLKAAEEQVRAILVPFDGWQHQRQPLRGNRWVDRDGASRRQGQPSTQSCVTVHCSYKEVGETVTALETRWTVIPSSARYCITASNNTWGPIVGVNSLRAENSDLSNNNSQTLRAVRERILSGLRVEAITEVQANEAVLELYLWVTNVAGLGAMRRKAVTTAK